MSAVSTCTWLCSIVAATVVLGGCWETAVPLQRSYDDPYVALPTPDEAKPVTDDWKDGYFQCRENWECPQSTLCIEGFCSESHCKTNLDCPTQRICVRGQCLREKGR